LGCCWRLASTLLASGIPQFTADLKRMKGSLFPEFLSNGEDQ
jgi:hypothetical protein